MAGVPARNRSTRPSTAPAGSASLRSQRASVVGFTRQVAPLRADNTHVKG